MKKFTDIKIVAVPAVIVELFNQLRLNGIEATIPIQLTTGHLEMSCIVSEHLDKLLCNWRDFIACEYTVSRKK